MTHNNSTIVSTNLFLASKLVEAFVALDAAKAALDAADLRLELGFIANRGADLDTVIAAEAAYGEAADSVGALMDALVDAPELVSMASRAAKAA